MAELDLGVTARHREARLPLWIAIVENSKMRKKLFYRRTLPLTKSPQPYRLPGNLRCVPVRDITPPFKKPALRRQCYRRLHLPMREFTLPAPAAAPVNQDTPREPSELKLILIREKPAGCPVSQKHELTAACSGFRRSGAACSDPFWFKAFSFPNTASQSVLHIF